MNKVFSGYTRTCSPCTLHLCCPMQAYNTAGAPIPAEKCDPAAEDPDHCTSLLDVSYASFAAQFTQEDRSIRHRGLWLSG